MRQLRGRRADSAGDGGRVLELRRLGRDHRTAQHPALGRVAARGSTCGFVRDPRGPVCRPRTRVDWPSERHLRDLLGVAQVHKSAYASHVMTLVDLPWRSAKASTRLQSLQAWGNRGPVPHDLLGVRWDPTPTPDFTTLVPKALEGDLNSGATLQVAGGIALVTDKLLMSNRGSAASSGEVPFRANVNDVVDNLGPHRRRERPR